MRFELRVKVGFGSKLIYLDSCWNGYSGFMSFFGFWGYGPDLTFLLTLFICIRSKLYYLRLFSMSLFDIIELFFLLYLGQLELNLDS